MQELYQWLALPLEYQPVFTTLIMGSVMGAVTWSTCVPMLVTINHGTYKEWK